MIGVCEERQRSQNEAIKGYSIFGAMREGRQWAVCCFFGETADSGCLKQKVEPILSPTF